jgi:hypothetical protein
MSYASSARTVFVNLLVTLDHLVAKAREAGMADDVLAEKLTDDMFPLELQFRVALNQVLLALNRKRCSQATADQGMSSPTRFAG